MPGSKYNDINSEVPNNLVTRLVRERHLRRTSQSSSPNDVTDGNRGTEISGQDISLPPNLERYLEEAAALVINGARERSDGRPNRQRLLVVANRLPVSAVRRGEDSWSLDISAGGLVSALLGVKEFEARWIGWAGVNVPDEIGQNTLTTELAEKRCIPVFLDEEVVHQYYNGYCNNINFFLISSFHTYDYARHFVSACTRILGLEGTPEGVEDQGKLTRVAAFPIGIDSDRFIRALEVPQVQEHVKELKERFAGRKVMLGVDRLDMIKGIPQKILAFEKFLEENPYWRDKVVLLQIAVPTRTDVPEYKKLTSQVHEIVGRINGRFGTLSAVPIHHLDRSLDFHALCALYSITDVAIVTSLRDGMNLVSYEFVACQDSKKGVLILSEFAGAAQSLGAGAILVNPWNITEVAAAISQALNMPAEEREKRHRHNFDHVTNHTAQQWAEFFISELNGTIIEAQQRMRQVPPHLVFSDAIQRYLQSKNRLLILGFDATLTEQIDSPGRRGSDQIKEMELKLHPKLKGPLKKLCNDPKTTIVVLSGSETRVLDDIFGEYNMWLAAENGMFLRSTGGEWMTTMPEHLNMDWVDSVMHVFEYFTERTPRSHCERRETSLVWNYKYADVEFGRLQARDMLQHLWTGPMSNSSVDVVQGSRSIEVRAVGVTKGAAIDRILGEIVHSEAICIPIDYVLCIGHFLGKDEDVYTFFEPELPRDTTGMSRTRATDAMKLATEQRATPTINSSKCQGKRQQSGPKPDKKASRSRRSSPENISWNVLDLKRENYFSCAVGRTRTSARYLLKTSDDVVSFLKEMVEASSNTSLSI
ncbi:alpha,alpha-trehalose-phosphate synthase [UDP-forming] 1-like [Olea europaea var. sylvestris]|uniref:alpha,alpha-trehalose-phosphate synthase [UDP-forming] 1-like n=1 Tax=Olea europaea var. sylvestris TaxID=158386 RepID=UPI000C1D3A68|nr:alpha,alpha-trehalose-phosphate synthase [UDP-forming] 1-like [Olea europaea var. sylvestris]